MQAQFSKLESHLRALAKSRDELRATLARIEAQRTTYSDSYTDSVQAAAKDAHTKSLQAAYERACELIDEAMNQASINAAVWKNLDSPRLANALKIIELSKGELQAEDKRKIVNEFVGDPQSLRALRQVFKSMGSSYDGGISDLLYNPGEAATALKQIAMNAIIQNGSLNSLASSIRKIASREGIDFPALIDEAGATEAIRVSAGLAPRT